jgi:hypothetical protein
MPTAAQLRALHTTRQRVLPDDEAYRALLRHTFPQKRWLSNRPSSTELDVQEARIVLDALASRARTTATPTPAPAPPQRQQSAPQPPQPRYRGSGRAGHEVAHLSQRQANEIARLESDLGWDDPARMRGFIKRQLGLKDSAISKTVEGLTMREASTVITGLRRLVSHPWDAH